MPTDDRSFDEAFPAMFEVAFKVARRFVVGIATAEDLAAEAIARVYVRWGRLGSAPYRDAYVARVVANLGVDWHRRDRDAIQPRATSDMEERVTTRIRVGNALARLPQRQREAVALCLLAGFSEAEAAHAMEVSAGTVKAHLHRAREALRVLLETDLSVEKETDHVHTA